MLLAIDTATPYVSVALLHDGVTTRGEAERPMRHGESLAPLVEQVLRDAGATRRDLSTVAVGVGPGAFTGLRVGLVTAQLLGHALDVPVHGVSSLDVLAAAAVADGVEEPFVATIDARRKELFWAAYDARGLRVSDPAVARPADMPTERLAVGAASEVYPDAFARTRGPLRPDAGTLAGLVAGGAATLVAPEPVYLRRPDAAVPGPPKRVS